jgi:hypothetical protein
LDADFWPADQVERRPIATLIPHARNARTHSDAQVAQIAASIREWGWTIPVLVDEEGTIIAGHGRVLAGLQLGLADVPTMTARGWSDAKRRAYMLADNKLALNAGWDDELLRSELADLMECGMPGELLGFDDDELGALLGGLDDDRRSGQLMEAFGGIPFSVLNAREGWWQQRKRAWISLGIRSELGRDGTAYKAQDELNAIQAQRRVAPGGSPRPAADYSRSHARGNGAGGQMGDDQTGTSIFDPVLCELAYRWFSPPGGTVLDPFAGGSVRGVVAAKLGRAYQGIDLSDRQIAANREQWAAMDPTPLAGGPQAADPVWTTGDSRQLLDAAGGPAVAAADMLFSCPPYADLEIYSDDPRDLSRMDWPGFLTAYREIIGRACAQLRQDRFAVWVVGEVRGPGDGYRSLVAETVAAFQAGGLAYYNEAILVTMVGSLTIRVGRQFAATRKLGKTHQNVLVFLKGDARRAVAACGTVETPDLDALLPDSADDPLLL